MCVEQIHDGYWSATIDDVTLGGVGLGSSSSQRAILFADKVCDANENVTIDDVILGGVERNNAIAPPSQL